ncbi:MAG: thioredoxin domain-containing protein [Eubacteriales bacterium]|jgi:thioredoxin 1
MIITDGTFINEVFYSSKPVMVYFWGDWCEPCKQMSPIIDELEKEFEGRVKICKMNVGKGAVTAARYDIMSVPMMLFFMNGEVINVLIGKKTKNQIWTFLQENT